MRKGMCQVDNAFIISRYFLSLSRAESIDKKEYKHEFAFVEETAVARWPPPVIDTGTAPRHDPVADGFFPTTTPSLNGLLSKR